MQPSWLPTCALGGGGVGVAVAGGFGLPALMRALAVSAVTWHPRTVFRGLPEKTGVSMAEDRDRGIALER